VPPIPHPLIYTLCFLTAPGQVLMLKRLKPPNMGLWNGVGGHIEPGEHPTAACLREVREETGVSLPAACFTGVLTWHGFETPPGGLYIFTASLSEPVDFMPCDEGQLAWQPLDWVLTSPEVVSNIHHFLPAVLNGALPLWHHFSYRENQIRSYEVRPLPDGTI